MLRQLPDRGALVCGKIDLCADKFASRIHSVGFSGSNASFLARFCTKQSVPSDVAFSDETGLRSLLHMLL